MNKYLKKLENIIYESKLKENKELSTFEKRTLRLEILIFIATTIIAIIGVIVAVFQYKVMEKQAEVANSSNYINTINSIVQSDMKNLDIAIISILENESTKIKIYCQRFYMKFLSIDK